VLFASGSPALQTIRPSTQIDERYGFSDASGSGFGGYITLPGRISYRVGGWGRDTEDSSLIEALKARVKVGNLRNCKMFMITDLHMYNPTLYSICISDIV
jgi:hypothetical protein